MANTTSRLKRHSRIRRKISGTDIKPRVSIFRSNKSLQVQLIDDENSKTLVGMSSKAITDKVTKTEKAKLLGKKFADACLAIGKDIVVFDRGGYKYHGRVKALADSLREAGLKF